MQKRVSETSTSEYAISDRDQQDQRYVPPLEWQKDAIHKLSEEDLAFVNKEHVYGHSCSMVRKPDDAAAAPTGEYVVYEEAV